MPDQTRSEQEEDQGAALVATLTAHLEATVSTKICAPANREPLALSFVEMLGRLVEFLEQVKAKQPGRNLDPGQMAALLYFVENLQVDHVGADAAWVMLKMVEGAKKWAREQRRAAAH